MNTNFDVRKIQAKDATLHTVSAGQGNSIIFVHGWPHTWEIWRPVMEKLQSQYQVIAFDLRGIGQSDQAENG